MIDFHIIGAQRCGTTSLHATLQESKHIDMSMPKEPKFFETGYHKGFKEYIRHFQFQESFMARGTARPQSLMLPFVAHRVREMLPESKIIILLRHPLIRMYSSWLEYHSMRPGRLYWSWGDIRLETL